MDNEKPKPNIYSVKMKLEYWKEVFILKSVNFPFMLQNLTIIATYFMKIDPQKRIIDREDFWTRKPTKKSGSFKENFLLVEAEYESSKQ